MTIIDSLGSVLEGIADLQVRYTDLDKPKKSPCVTITPERLTHTPEAMQVDRVYDYFILEVYMETFKGNVKTDLSTFESLLNTIKNTIYDHRTLDNTAYDCKVDAGRLVQKKGETNVQFICQLRLRVLTLLGVNG